MTLDWLQERLEEFEWDETSGTGMAWCPCHDDIGTSQKGLSVSRRNGRFYTYCHSCKVTLTQVVKQLEEGGERENGHVEHDEIPEVVLTQAGGLAWFVRKTGVARDVWERLGVEEVAGGVAFTFASTPQRKVRRRPKQISWDRPDLDAPPLWPHPLDDLPEHVMLVEGESDCGTAHAAGLPYTLATTKGASAAFPERWAQGLIARGVVEVTVCGDADEAGRKFEQRLVSEALEAGLKVNVIRIDEVVDPFLGVNDLNGLWRAADSQEQFLELVARCTHAIEHATPGMTYQELLDAATTEVNWLVPDLVAPGDKILLVGPQKSYKTWITLDLIRSLVSGRAFLNRDEWRPNRLCRVLLIEEEGSLPLFSRRVAKMQLTEEQGERMLVLHKQGVRFTDKTMISTVIARCKAHEADLVIFDPLQRMIPGVNENDSSETGVIWDEVQRLQQACPETVVMVVHHANKAERLTWESIRGSSRHAGEVDLGIFVSRDEGTHSSVKVMIEGRDVQLDLDEGFAFECEVQIEEEQFLLDATGTTAVTTSKAGSQIERVLSAVSRGCETRTKIMRDTGLSDSTVRAHLRTLCEDEKVLERDGDGPRAPKTYVLREG